MTEVARKVAAARDIPAGEARVFEIGDLELAVCNVDGAFFAVENLCTHDGGPLGEGHVVDHAIECPRHGARFDVKTGAVLRAPAVVPVRAFATRVADGDVYVLVDEDEI